MLGKLDHACILDIYYEDIFLIYPITSSEVICDNCYSDRRFTVIWMYHSKTHICNMQCKYESEANQTMRRSGLFDRSSGLQINEPYVFVVEAVSDPAKVRTWGKQISASHFGFPHICSYCTYLLCFRLCLLGCA